MREFSTTFDFREMGLRPDDRIRRSGLLLTEAFNVRAGEVGLEPYELVDDPFEGSRTIAHPHPQLFRGEAQTWLFGASGISSVNEATTPWSVTAETLYQALDRTLTASLAGSGIWHFADMRTAWYAFNGTDTVFRTGFEDLEGLAPKTYAQSAVTIKTGCVHRGRIIYGGMDPGDFWSPVWESLFQAWHQPGGVPDPANHDDVGSNWVGWSSIGGGDFPLWLFYPDWLTHPYAPTQAIVEERLKRNEFGLMPMPWQGEVLKVMPLGPHVIVYGTNGVTALSFTTNDRDIPPTYGMRHLRNVGVAGRGAAGGDENGHLFVDRGGDLWLVTPQLEVRRLGYKEFISPMTADDLLVHHDPIFGDFHITDGTSAFLLAGNGLTEHRQRLTSLAYASGRVGLGSNAADTEARVVTNGFDLGQRGLKTISNIGLRVEVGANDKLEVAMDYRFRKNDSWKRSKWYPVNHEGNAFPRVSGVEFRLVVRSDAFTNLYLDNATVRWQVHDKRALRGIDADSATPRTD